MKQTPLNKNIYNLGYSSAIRHVWEFIEGNYSNRSEMPQFILELEEWYEEESKVYNSIDKSEVYNSLG